MLDIKRIREEPDAVRKGIEAKGSEPELVDQALGFDTRVRELKTETEILRAEQRTKSKDFGKLKKEGADVEALQNELNQLKANISGNNDELTKLEDELKGVLDLMPNVPHADMPPGKDAEDNVEVSQWGDIPKHENALPHWDIGARYGLEIERGSKMSGSGFPMLIGPYAKLERALAQFFIDTHTQKNGYTEVYCPFLVRAHAMYASGQLPKAAGEQYHTERDDLYLIPTAETPLTNIHADEIFAESDLPKRYTSYTYCFRREAGAAGSDTRGLIRMHQFTKVEMMEYVHPNKSYEVLETLTRNAEKLLEELELPYRKLNVCSGDSTLTNTKQYDLEVYSIGVQRWLEVSSCSNFEDFQSRRAKIRYKDSETGKNEFVHTLNGSGLATSRILVSLVENNQQADGSVNIPKALQDYYGGDKL